MITPFRADYDFREASEDSTLPEFITHMNKIINLLGFANKSISLQANFNAYIAQDVTIPATSSVKIQHFLGVKPKWRIILRQTGNGVITDIPSEWDDKVISLYNNGSVDVTLSVFIARE